MRKLLLLLTTLSLTAQAQIIFIPFAGTNDLTTNWWTTTLTNASGVFPWQAWEVVDTNFATVQLEFATAIGTTIPGMISSALSGPGFAPQTYVTGVSNNVVAEHAFAVGISNSLAATQAGLSDAQTNAQLNSGRFAAIVSNSVSISAGSTNVVGWVTNLAGVDFTITSTLVTNGSSWSSNGPSLLYSFDGVTWNPGSGSLVTTGPVEVAFFSGSIMTSPGVQIPLPGYLTNVTVWQLSRSDYYGKTNANFGTHLQASDPVYPQDVATWASVQNLLLQTAWWSAQNDVQVNGYNLNLSSTWQEATTATTNTAAYHLRFLGQDTITVSESQPMSVTINSCTVTNSTNVVVKVATNGVSIAPRLEFSHYIAPPVWSWLTNSPTVSGTNYVWLFVRPYGDSGFLIAMVPNTNLPSITLSGNVTLPGTINATNGAWIGSNSWLNVPALAAGDNFYASSNGVPHVIWKDQAATLHTNRLVP